MISWGTDGLAVYLDHAKAEVLTPWASRRKPDRPQVPLFISKAELEARVIPGEALQPHTHVIDLPPGL